MTQPAGVHGSHGNPYRKARILPEQGRKLFGAPKYRPIPSRSKCHEGTLVSAGQAAPPKSISGADGPPYNHAS